MSVVRRSPRVRVLVADEAEWTRRGTALVLGGESGLTVVAEASDAASMVGTIPRSRPHVVLATPALAAELLAAGSGDDAPAVIVVGEQADAADVKAALRLGAAGYLLRSDPVAVLTDAVRQVAAGTVLVSPALSDLLLRTIAADGTDGEPPLTARELQVLRLVAVGASNRDIAEQLFISENTVKNHVRRILEKTGARSRSGAVAHAVREGLVVIH